MSKNQDKSPVSLWKRFLIVMSVTLTVLIIYILYRNLNSSNRLIPISVIALIAGAIIENKRLTDKWSTVFKIALASLALSLSAFFPGKKEYDYVLENHIAFWPYCFLFFFLFISVAFHNDKIKQKMTEGITLIMSVGFIYWFIDHGFYNLDFKFLKLIMSLGLLIAGFSIINAFLNIHLSKSVRLFLSIWSSLVMLFLAIDNINEVYQNGDIEDYVFLSDKVYVAVEYFLLGICSIHMLQNFLMIFRFLPGKTTFFNKEYFEDLRELNKEHIERYSENQSNALVSFICLILSIGFFSLNYRLNLLPRNTAIWLVLFVLSYVVYFYEYRNKTYNQQVKSPVTNKPKRRTSRKRAQSI